MKCPLHPQEGMMKPVVEQHDHFVDVVFFCSCGCRWRKRMRMTDLRPDAWGLLSPEREEDLWASGNWIIDECGVRDADPLA